jgi:hypothetical protein
MYKPKRRFTSEKHMIDTHTAMFGEPGQIAAKLVIKHAPALFDEPMDPLTFRVLFAPGEMGPYNRHLGYTVTEGAFIVANRKCCEIQKHSLVLMDGFEDLIVHELTHNRQTVILGTHEITGTRGTHRDRGWYAAITEACPRYLGVAFPESLWPNRKSVREGKSVRKEVTPGRLDEPTVCHWPMAMRGHPLLPLLAARA